MKLPFLNRENEQARLVKALKSPPPVLLVVYGRRRCGKSSLLQKIATGQDVYFLADLRESRLQIQALADEFSRVFPDFNAAAYSTWDALIRAMNSRATRPVTVFLDEFPYLVQNDPALPSLLQHYLDRPGSKHLNWVLCGSSQHMMHGLTLDRTSPLYGRSRETLRIGPLQAGWLADAFHVHAAAAIETWSIWGGVPRYWELAREYDSLAAAVQALVLDRNGILHEEPLRLLYDDMRSPVQAYSLLSLVGAGCHRISELAARLGKPAGSLSRPLSTLIDLGYLRREVPFGENVKSTRRSLYKLADEYMRFYFRFVTAAQSLIEKGFSASVWRTIQNTLPNHVGTVWEDLARESVPHLRLFDQEWGIASRWWGRNPAGEPMELDVVAHSLDGKAVLVGEAKWTVRNVSVDRQAQRLTELAPSIPSVQGKRVYAALWLRGGKTGGGNAVVVTPPTVLKSLRY